MKKRSFTKMATLLALALVMSIAMPVLAAAAPAFLGFSNLNYSHDGTVTGYVYYDGDVGGVSNSVYVDLLNDPTLLGEIASAVTATYHSGQSNTTGNYYYWFTASVNASVYEAVYVREQVGNNVSDAVNRQPAPSPGGGGFFPIPPGGIVAGDTINAPANGVVSASALTQAFANHDHVTIVISGEFAILPIETLQEIGADKSQALLTIKSDLGTITLPLAQLLYDDLVDASGSDLSDLVLRVTIAAADAETSEAIEEAAAAEGGEAAADAVEFNMVAEDEDGNSFDFNSHGSTYIQRTIPLNGDVDPNKATGVVYAPGTAISGSFSFKPTYFDDDTANIFSTSNSIYTVLTFDKAFSDVPAGHWAEEDITTLANKLVVYGVSEDTFDLDRNITRAEFAALAVRSLGLSSSGQTAAFSDVSADAWYASEVAIAAEAGIVYGYEDGTFRPNNIITRQELASMVIRAREYAGVTNNLSEADQAGILGAFSDASSIGAWAAEALAAAVDNEIVFGMGDGTIAPQGDATRAQATAMLKRYLSNVNFIN